MKQKKRTALEKNEKQVIGYKVGISSVCTHSHREDEAYGSWEESYDNSLGEVYKTNAKDSYPDVLSIFNFNPGEFGFVVWIEYSFGDSFGHAERGSVEAVGIFKDEAIAKELATAIKNWEPANKNSSWNEYHKFKFKTSDGQIFEYGFAPWSGYFETLEEVHVASFQLNK